MGLLVWMLLIIICKLYKINIKNDYFFVQSYQEFTLIFQNTIIVMMVYEKSSKEMRMRVNRIEINSFGILKKKIMEIRV